MKRKPLLCTLFFLGALVVLPGCGRGYLTPKIAVNTIDLQKVELSKSGITAYERQFFPVTYDDRFLREKVTREGEKIFGTSGYFQEVQFLGNEYYLHKNYYFMYVDIIRKSDMKRVLYLSTPESANEFAAFPITMGDRNYLAVYVSQRATSNSSTFFVVDSQFKIVYKEHLLRAKEVGFTHSDRYGNCVVLKSRDFWYPDGVDKPRVDINGDWVYYMKGSHE